VVRDQRRLRAALEHDLPAATHLKLEPSIWQDHPGSFSYDSFRSS
jgi:hypothetical protein